jgi:hypothetical protein
VGAAASILISMIIIISYSLVIGNEYIVLLIIFIISLIATNYFSSASWKKIMSYPHSKTKNSCPTQAIAIRVGSLFAQAFASLWNRTNDTQNDKILVDKKIKQDRKRERVISSIWIALIMIIIIFSSSDVSAKTEQDLSAMGNIFLPLIVAVSMFYFVRNCPDLYVAIAIILCVIWIGVLGDIFSSMYVRNIIDLSSAKYAIIHILPSLGFLPFLTMYFYKVRYRSQFKNRTENQSE